MKAKKQLTSAQSMKSRRPAKIAQKKKILEEAAKTYTKALKSGPALVSKGELTKERLCPAYKELAVTHALLEQKRRAYRNYKAYVDGCPDADDVNRVRKIVEDFEKSSAN